MGFALLLLLLMRSATTFASNLTSTASKLREIHRRILSLKAHNSVATLAVAPIARTYPFTHLPKLSLMIPPPPAKPELPIDEPSEFSLNQLRGGRSHFTWILMRPGDCFSVMPRYATSATLAEVCFCRSLGVLVLPKTMLFRRSQRDQIAMGKIIPQSISDTPHFRVLWQFRRSQSRTLAP